MIIMASMFAAIACSGCTAFVAEDYPVSQSSASIAIADTHAMRVVVPAPIGTPLPQKPAPAPVTEPGMHEKLEQARNTLVEYGVEVPPSYETNYAQREGQLRASLTSGFNEAFVPETILSGYRGDILSTEGWSSSPTLRALRGQLGAQRLAFGTLGQERYDAEFAFSAPRQTTGLSFDIGVVPSLSYAEEGDFRTRRIGAEFRFGQHIDQRGSDDGLPSWYFFAGADGQAIIFNNGSASRGFGVIDGLQLRDQITVGDIQAGLNIRRYGTNFSFNYIRREVEYELNSERFKRDEGFGGITLTWKR